MKLSRLLIIIISILWLLIFIGTLLITVQNSRDYLLSQMQSHAQDTATSLGLSLSTSVERSDLATVNSMLDAIYDRGYYHQIAIRKISGDILTERSQTLRIGDVPEWFMRAITLNTPKEKALIMSGWKQIGTVEVTSHPGYAYRQLWRVTTQAFWWTLIIGILSLLAVILTMRFALAPLSEMEAQARGISRRQFTIMKKIPWVRELRRVTKAMNTMCRAMERMLVEETARTEKMRAKAYLDGLTGLPNGRSFNEQLSHLIAAPDEFVDGALLIVRLDKFKIYNEAYGHAAGDAALLHAKEILEQQCARHERVLLARLNGAEFAILIPNITQADIGSLADSIIQQLSASQPSSGQGEAAVAVFVGAAFHQPEQSASTLLSTADAALQNALERGTSCWRLYGGKPAVKAMAWDNAQWKELITAALHDNKFTLHFQPVVSCDDKATMHHVALARMPAPDGSLLPAGTFLPAARQLGLLQEIDRHIVQKMLAQLETDTQSPEYFAVKISAASLHDEEFIEWLCAKLTTNKYIAKHLIFEAAEYGVVANIQASRKAISRIRKAGSEFSIGNFGHSNISFGYLRNIHADYIKIDGSYIRHLAHNEDSQFFVQSLAGIAHALNIRVIAEYVETAEDFEALKTLPMDGAQGYYIGKPT